MPTNASRSQQKDARKSEIGTYPMIQNLNDNQFKLDIDYAVGILDKMFIFTNRTDINLSNDTKEQDIA